MFWSVLDLGAAGVGADNAIEVIGEFGGGLAVAARAVPGELARGDNAGEPLEEFVGIGGAEGGVI